MLLSNMNEWLKISCVLCMFGFLRELRPSEPFITEFLMGPWRNLTQDEVNREVYPVGTYSYLAQVVLVFLITDFLLYKPLIVTMGLLGIIIWSMLLWTYSLNALKVVEFFYGTYMAAEVAYYTYIYAKVDKTHYPRVTSHTRAAMFAGKFVASVLGQLLIYFKLMDYRELNYITLFAQIAATLWAIFLPKVETSLYFHRKEYLEENPVKLLWSHFYNAYTNKQVLQWSIWYAMGFCGYLQVMSYVQILWNDIENQPSIVWNGAVEALLTALATIFALIAGYVHGSYFKPFWSLIFVAILSLLEGLAILLSCRINNIYTSYAGYIIFGALYAFTITVASAEVARHLEEDSFGLVFGINTLLALVLQTILTIVVVSDTALALNTQNQYTVYAIYFIVIGFIYFLYALVNCVVSRKFQKTNHDVSLAE